jgi:hypothetical protein
MVIKKLLYVLFAVIIVLSVYTFSKEERNDIELPERPEEDLSGYFHIKDMGISTTQPNRLENLDKKRGIKNLILGTNFKSYNFDPDWMIEEDSITNFRKATKFPEGKSVKIGKSKIERISLVFYKDTLISIDFIMDRFSKEKTIYNAMVFLYGYPNYKEYYRARDKIDFTIDNILDLNTKFSDSTDMLTFIPREYYKPTHASYRETLPYTHTFCAAWISKTSILEYYNVEYYSESYIHTKSNVIQAFNSIYQSHLRINSDANMQELIKEIQRERRR